MQQDSTTYDTIAERPLPGWLIKQKAGLNAYQPVKAVMKEDKSLQISFIVTGVLILLIISILTIYFIKKGNRTGRTENSN